MLFPVLFILSQIKKRVFFKNQTRLSNGQAIKRMYNPEATKFQRIKTSWGLSAMVSYVKKT